MLSDKNTLSQNYKIEKRSLHSDKVIFYQQMILKFLTSSNVCISKIMLDAETQVIPVELIVADF